MSPQRPFRPCAPQTQLNRGAGVRASPPASFFYSPASQTRGGSRSPRPARLMHRLTSDAPLPAPCAHRARSRAPLDPVASTCGASGGLVPPVQLRRSNSAANLDKLYDTGSVAQAATALANSCCPGTACLDPVSKRAGVVSTSCACVVPSGDGGAAGSDPTTKAAGRRPLGAAPGAGTGAACASSLDCPQTPTGAAGACVGGQCAAPCTPGAADNTCLAGAVAAYCNPAFSACTTACASNSDCANNITTTGQPFGCFSGQCAPVPTCGSAAPVLCGDGSCAASQAACAPACSAAPSPLSAACASDADCAGSGGFATTSASAPRRTAASCGTPSPSPRRPWPPPPRSRPAVSPRLPLWAFDGFCFSGFAREAVVSFQLGGRGAVASVSWSADPAGDASLGSVRTGPPNARPPPPPLLARAP